MSKRIGIIGAGTAGKIEYRQVSHDDIPSLASRFDLLVVCVGKGPFGQMFERQPEYSPFDKPQRTLCVGLFQGIAQLPTRAVTMYFSPGAGEMIEIPMWSFGGLVNALVIENLPGGELEILAKARYVEDPKAFIKLLLDKLRQHYPTCAERMTPPEFAIRHRVPTLVECLAWFECQVIERFAIHDHALFLARVFSCGANGGSPLLFFGSSYCRQLLDVAATPL